MNRRIRGLLTIVSVLFINILCFQNCSNVIGHNMQVAGMQSGNGDGYTGMVTVMAQTDSASPCAGLDESGNPLPNGKIVLANRLSGDKSTFLVRQNCQDIPAKTLSNSDVSFTNGSVTYQGQTFDATQPGDFDVISPTCPAGKSRRAGVTPINLFALSQNWLALYPLNNPGWYADEGIDVDVAGAIDSIPSFSLTRNDPKFLDQWRRTGQGANLLSNTQYVFSVLARPGTLSAVDVHVVKQFNDNQSTPQDESISVTCDVASGTATVNWAVNMNNVTAVVNTVPNGFQCMVYFTTPGTDQSSTAIGVDPATGGADYGNVGDSIFATAAQLVRVNQMCQ